MTSLLFGETKPIQSLKGHKEAISSIAFSADGKYLASGSFDTTVQLWDVRSSELKRTLKGLDQKVSTVVFSPDSKILAGGSWMLHAIPQASGQGKPSRLYAGEVKLWDIETGEIKKNLTWHSAPMWALAYSPSGQMLAGGTGLAKKEDGKYYGEVILWDIQSAEIKKVLTAHGAPVWALAFSPDEQRLAAGSGLDLQSGTYEVLVWNIQTGKLENVLHGHSGRVISVAYSPSGDVLASASADHTVRLWDAKTGTLKSTLTKEGDVEEAPSTRPGQPAYSDRVKLESPGFFSVVKKGWTNSVAFSNDGKFLAGIAADGKIHIWDVASGKSTLTFVSPAHGVYSVAFSPDGKFLATGNADGTLNLWDVHLGK
jgi:WD40 repeat protein